MAQPIIYKINAWDATKPGEIGWLYSGNQVVKNQLIIRNNLTNAIVYDKTVSSFQLKHTVGVGSLTNGICYSAQVRVFDGQDKASEYSQKEIFYCLSTPVFSFGNCPPNTMIGNSSFEAALAYSQAQSEPLNNFQFFLYDEKQNEIMCSKTLYDTSALRYTYSMLEDKDKYFFRATGETLNHMIVDTGFVPVSVQYILPSCYAMVDLQNLYKDGMVRVRSNMVSIVGSSSPDPAKFLGGNKVDLTDDNSWVKFDVGYKLNGNFTLQMRCRGIIQNGVPLHISDGVNSIEVKYMTGKFASQVAEKGYFLLTAENGLANYVQMSEYLDLPLNSTEPLYIWIRRVGCVYEIRAQRQTGGEEIL